MSDVRRVVITGIGPVTSAGIGRASFAAGIWAGRCLARPVDPGLAARLRTRFFVPLPEFALRDYDALVSHDSAMQTGDRMAVLAAKLALEDAGYGISKRSERFDVTGAADAGVVLGTGLSGLQTAFESYLAHRLPPELPGAGGDARTTNGWGKPLFNRLVVPRTMTNSPAAWMSICFGLTGACLTLNASCASGTYAIGEGFRRIRHGYDRVVLAGGVETLQDPSGFMLRGFDVLGALTQSPDGQPGPFGEGRSGFLFAEGGACVLVLEDLASALARGAPIYAELLDYRCNSDAASIVQMDPEGRQVRSLLRDLSRSGKVDYLNAHGTGTLANDALESRIVQDVFGPPGDQPLINSTKGIIGHTLGASGAIEAAVTALSIQGRTVHPNAVREPLPGLNLPREAVSASLGRAVSVSYGFGGHNAGLLFARYP